MYDYLLYFLIFSFLGWCAEVVFHVIKTGSFVNRGLAKGPVCPIYGVGICLSYLLLGWIDSFLLLALFSMAVATAVEFFVGLITDKLLGQRLWDYTLEKGNILGYVCPRFSLIWGLICASVIKIIPRLDPLIEILRHPAIYTLCYILLIIIIVDEKEQMILSKVSKNSGV